MEPGTVIMVLSAASIIMAFTILVLIGVISNLKIDLQGEKELNAKLHRANASFHRERRGWDYGQSNAVTLGADVSGLPDLPPMPPKPNSRWDRVLSKHPRS